jgi:ATP-dependent Lon protease
MLPLRDTLVFPRATRSVHVGRLRSSRLVETLPPADSTTSIALFLQRDPAIEDPMPGDLHSVGVLARVVQRARASRERPGYVLLVAALQRVRLLAEVGRDPFLKTRVELLEDQTPRLEDPEYLALRDGLRKLLASFVQRSPQLPGDALPVIAALEDAAALTDIAASTLPDLTIELRQRLLETLDVRERMRMLTEELIKLNDKLDLEQKIQTEIRDRVSGQQREYLLREQMKAIQRELGERDEGAAEAQGMRTRIEQAGLPEEPRKEALRELSRLEQLPTGSPEQTVVRNYLDWLVALPWSKTSSGPVDLDRAEQILDEDHYDLEKVKERILEYLAVMRLKQTIRGPILCFVGPPGVGKTSLGRSIARALGRSFARIALGGMHDEAELRGHRRTYVGALPGQIIQALRRAGTSDPVFMLDEVDKLGRDFRGDPAAALLEILDPEQNFSFRDHYLDVPFDLSRILFIGTANVLDPIPPPLLDRMEVLELSGYSEEEKLQIARRYLLPKQVRENGLGDGQIEFTDAALLELARHYTHEAGVRGLERQIGAICRKHARRIARQAESLVVTPDIVRRELGPQRFRIETEIARRTQRPGVAVGLAWTPHGGDVLFVEATQIPGGRGGFTLTGQLGAVMQESARAALTWVRANASGYGIGADQFRKADLHVHVPAGAVPKDGPSAGVTMATAIASALAGRTVNPDVAMTGEITLSGHVLPVGGIREKVLAARRSGVHTVVLPEMNEVNVVQDVPPAAREGMTFVFVATIEEALEHALGLHPVGAVPMVRPPEVPPLAH